MNSSTLLPNNKASSLIDAVTLLRAEKSIESCENCNPTNAEIDFAWILDEITGSDSTVSDYIPESPAKCPDCRREIIGKTLLNRSIGNRDEEVHGEEAQRHLSMKMNGAAYLP